MSNTSNPKPYNAINWFEIPVTDLPRAIKSMPHAVFPSQCPAGGHAVAGAIVADGPHLTPGTAGTVIYLDCKDGVAAALARATAAGAKVVLPHMGIGENGFIAIVDDLDGNRVGLHAMTA